MHQTTTRPDGIRSGTRYLRPDENGSVVRLPSRLGCLIDGDWTPPVHGRYEFGVAPATGGPFLEFADGSEADVDAAVRAARRAAVTWGRTTARDRSAVLLRAADRISEHVEELAVLQAWETGRTVRESLTTDVPLAIDHFRYFAAAIRIQQGSVTQPSDDLVAYDVPEPIGVVAQIIPGTAPVLTAAWKLAPALAAGDTVVLKPARSAPASVLRLVEIMHEVLPDGVVNVVTGSGARLGQYLVEHEGVAKVAFTGSTATGRQIMRYAIAHVIPSTLELGGASPDVYFSDIADEQDALAAAALTGFSRFAIDDGAVVGRPSRALLQEPLMEGFLDAALARVRRLRLGDPLDVLTDVGPVRTRQRLLQLQDFLELGVQEGCEVLVGGDVGGMSGDLAGGSWIEPTVLHGRNDMRVFQEEVAGPVIAVASFQDEPQAVRLANDSRYGLTAGVWTRDGDRAFRMSRAVHAGRVWVNSVQRSPAGAAFGGYRESGFGREADEQTLREYQQVKSVVVDHGSRPLSLFD